MERALSRNYFWTLTLTKQSHLTVTKTWTLTLTADMTKTLPLWALQVGVKFMFGEDHRTFGLVVSVLALEVPEELFYTSYCLSSLLHECDPSVSGRD